MTFSESIASCFRKYATFQGRATRSEYWWFFAFQVLAGLGIGLVGVIMGLSEEGINGLSLLLGMLCLLPYLAVTTRRLHDVNRSGWWQLIPYTIIGIIPFFYWLCRSGDLRANEYGTAV